MEIRVRSTGAVMLEEEFRRYVKATSGGSFDALTIEILHENGADPVLEGPQATGGTIYQYSVRNGVEEKDGQWFTKYVLGPIFTDTTDIDGKVTTAAEHEAAYKATKDADQAKAIRDDRNKRLADCDWTQLDDAPVDKTAWASYRQALRDLPSAAGFPWDVVWPEQPK